MTKKKSPSKRKTVEQRIKEAVREAIAVENLGTTVSHCTFAGVQFDEAATEAITTIAEGLLENAKALGQLAYVLKASNVEIESLLAIKGTS